MERPKMLYRKLGRSGVEVSALSFGTMRWVSEESCHATVQRGLDAGMNYFDTSTGYVGGMSELWTARAIGKRRSQALFSDKTQYGRAPSETEVRGAIEASLKRTGFTYFDFYQLWGLQSMDMLNNALRPGGFITGVRRAMEDGLVKYGAGFTFHGTPEVFRAAVDSGEFLSATVSYNIMNRKEEENIRYAERKGVGVLVMNPLGGGVLAMTGDPKFDYLRREGAGTAWGALRFLLANSGISAALVGVSLPSHVDADLLALDDGEGLRALDREELMRRTDAVQLVDPGFCTGCRYCEVCEHGFSPSKLMSAMREARLYGVQPQDMKTWIHSAYVHDTLPEAQLKRCVECGLCQRKCPQKLAIVDEIRRAKGIFR